MTRKLKLILLLSLFVFAVGFFIYKNKPVPQPPTTEISQTQAVFIINYGDGNLVTTSFVPRPGQTVFEALREVSEEKDIVLETQQYDFGVFVKAIGGYQSSAEMAWIYFINGNSGQVAADNQVITNGDLVEWKYVKPE